MYRDVKTLIGALTTERDSLDRAIAALKAIGQPQESDPVAKMTKARAKRGARHTAYDEATKRAVVAAMRDADANGEVLMMAAKRVSRDTGVAFGTVNSNWRTWEKNLNGSAAMASTAPEPELVTA